MYVCTRIKMERRHASQTHDYESLQGVRVRVEGGISTFLFFFLFYNTWMLSQIIYIYTHTYMCVCVCVCIRRNKVEKSVRTSFPANLIIQVESWKSDLPHVGENHHRETDKTIFSAHRRLGRVPVPTACVVSSLISLAEIEENKRNRGK